jgi:hypothetical protein
LCLEQSSWEYSDVDPKYGELWSAFDVVQGAQKIEALMCYDGFKDVQTLVDVGGNKGGTVAAIVAAHPHIRGINFDLPHIVAGAPKVPGTDLMKTPSTTNSSCRSSHLVLMLGQEWSTSLEICSGVRYREGIPCS